MVKICLCKQLPVKYLHKSKLNHNTKNPLTAVVIGPTSRNNYTSASFHNKCQNPYNNDVARGLNHTQATLQIAHPH